MGWYLLPHLPALVVARMSKHPAPMAEIPWVMERQQEQTDWAADYNRLASVACRDCGTVFSENVAALHAQRTGHRMASQRAAAA